MISLRVLFRGLLAVLLLGVTPATFAGAEDDQAARVAQTFVKDYFTKGYTKYFLRSPIVTPAAKAALKKLEAAARKQDPELGLDHDPVAQGQDHAEDYRVGKVTLNGDKATAQATSKGRPSIPLRLVRTKTGWQIDGAGEINLR